ncbi:MAG: hypothetical protein BEN18_10510 [Epulopiscium sp. Nuni2H_MBin001]|nr:MAG: hypothetical protein BEN18_10510 [Epulopiscium sp. Nuni2H_MBin001]
MKIQESAENYLEMILMLTNRLGQVRSIDIANEMNFSKPSVSIAMKNLRTNGYVDVDNKGHIKLTEKGLSIANSVYERHKLLSQFLVHIGVNEETAKKDACKMEHDLSDESLIKLREFMADK